MGRPPLGVKGVLIQLPADYPERIDALVGKQKRSEFIRKALKYAIETAEFRKDPDQTAE